MFLINYYAVLLLTTALEAIVATEAKPSPVVGAIILVAKSVIPIKFAFTSTELKLPEVYAESPVSASSNL
jgi:hypothetical protein